MPWHAERAQGQAVSQRSRPLRSGCRVGSAQEPAWLVECLRLVVGHASTVRPDPSTLGVVGERGSRREGQRPGSGVSRYFQA